MTKLSSFLGIFLLACSYQAMAEEEKAAEKKAAAPAPTVLSPSPSSPIINFSCTMKTLAYAIPKDSMSFVLDDEKHTVNGITADIFRPEYAEFRKDNRTYKLDRPTGGLAVLQSEDDYLIGICKRTDQPAAPAKAAVPEKKK